MIIASKSRDKPSGMVAGYDLFKSNNTVAVSADSLWLTKGRQRWVCSLRRLQSYLILIGSRLRTGFALLPFSLTLFVLKIFTI